MHNRLIFKFEKNKNTFSFFHVYKYQLFSFKKRCYYSPTKYINLFQVNIFIISTIISYIFQEDAKEIRIKNHGVNPS